MVATWNPYWPISEIKTIQLEVTVSSIRKKKVWNTEKLVKNPTDIFKVSYFIVVM